MAKLKKIDRAILKLLQQDARMSYTVIGDQVGLDASAVSRHVAALIRAGVVTGMHVAVDPLLTGLTTTVYMMAMLHEHGDAAFADFERELRNMPNVVEWARVKGVNDYVMKLLVKDQAHHAKLHAYLRRLPMVRRVRTLELMCNPHTKQPPLDDPA